MKKVGIIGRFGLGENFCDGQTVKTQNLARLLEKEQVFSIMKVDTYLYRRKNIKLLFDTVICMLTCKHIFLLVSVNGMNFYLRFLYYLNKVTRRNIYHYIIGSELLDMVKHNINLVKYLNALKVNWFEYDSGTQYLQEKGVKNAVTLSNFKLITPVPYASPYKNAENIYRFCTFSRVMEEKGITDAILAVKEINETQKKMVASLDIYGPLEADYEDKFRALLKDNQDCVRYMGVADSKNSVEILKGYYGLLFPTRWIGEGVPGTIIDAFAAGIPIVASDWNANREIIKDGEQGILYPNLNLKTLTDAVNWAVSHPDIMNTMRMESRKAFNKYMPETILKTIITEMGCLECKDCMPDNCEKRVNQ